MKVKRDLLWCYDVKLELGRIADKHGDMSNTLELTSKFVVDKSVERVFSANRFCISLKTRYMLVCVCVKR